MRNLVKLFMVLGVLAASVPAAAAPPPSLANLVSEQPAATLLLPYFEVDLGNARGVNTLFTVNNASATAVLAHVTVWSDLAVPVLAFNIYLTGYDTQAVSMRDILAGRLPATASDGQDPPDRISPQGLFSQDINFASCNGQLPYPESLGAEYVAHLQASLTGKYSPGFGGCAGVNYGDRIARGYVTVDLVNNCTLRVPGDPGYFLNGGFGDATNQNTLWGEFFMVRPNTVSGTFSRAGGALVHLRANAFLFDPAIPGNVFDPETAVPGQYTFYGTRVGWSAADNRQPLGSAFGARFFTGAPFRTRTALIVWRDPKVQQGVFMCGSYPPWYEGATATQITVFDEQEEVAGIPVAGKFAAATQQVAVGSARLPVPFRSGWLYLDLNRSLGDGNPAENANAAQSWVYVLQDWKGRFATGSPAGMIESAAHETRTPPTP